MIDKLRPQQGQRVPTVAAQTLAQAGTRCLCLNLMLLCVPAVADDDVLLGIDQEQIETVAQWWTNQGKEESATDSPVPKEAAKILWRVSRRSDAFLKSQLTKTSETKNTGDVTSLRGNATAVKRIELPEMLGESLGFSQMWLVNIRDGDIPTGLLCREIPTPWQTASSIDQPAAAMGVLLSAGNESVPDLIVAGSVEWYPNETAGSPPVPLGWTLLSGAGFDAGHFSEITKQNRSKFSASESDAFYDLLLAADRAGTSATKPAKQILPQNLLGNESSRKQIGQFIRLRLETARIQLIDAPALKQRNDQDHYWEIHGFGELENTTVQIEVKEGGEPIVFEHRYPVTITMSRLPPFLEQLVQDKNGRVEKAMLMRRVMIDAEGFFYRLWSYETDFVSSRGGERQIGPLIVASRLTEIEPGVTKESLNRFAWAVAIAFLLGLAAIIAFLVASARSDRKMRRVRQGTLPGELPLD